MSSEEVLINLEQVATTPEGVTRAGWLGGANAVLQESDPKAVPKAGQAALRICQKLYGDARSLDALPLALAVFQKGSEIGDEKLVYFAAVASGLLSSDTGDFAGSLEFHGRALEHMNELNDSAGASRSWTNIGSALCGVGRYELATVSFRHALTKLESVKGPTLARFGALVNLAQCALHTGEVDQGLENAHLALTESILGHGHFAVDAFNELLLRRNMVRLFVLQGNLSAAEEQVRIAKTLAARSANARASIAVATSQAVLDIARGHADIANTRLEQCLIAARPIRPAHRDTLACMVRADEAIGNSARALVRLQELSDLVHDSGAESAKVHIGLSQWRQSIRAFGTPDLVEMAARLGRQRDVASIPSTWPTLTRLAMGTALQIDPSAAHGTRVGTLSRLLAQACRLGPVQAFEIGSACQLHDVGIAPDQENLMGHFGTSFEGAGAEEDLAHCDAGWRILCDDDHPRILMARDIAKYHHAWVNGEGYPEGLAGRSIPLPARICAVADAYDNIMRTGLPEGQRTIAQGLSRLKTLSGTRLDSELVELFSETLEDETRNEGIELESGHGLTSFHQLINSLSATQRYI